MSVSLPSPSAPPASPSRRRRVSNLYITNLYKATMNRFLTKKKAKKSQPEPKPDLDFAAVLPSTDNFRTSLLMPNLSARFSMLREQDDPNSKLGKASDDSVLQPKRQSRLHEFGYVARGLSDIAEVSSISNPIRPPFLYERQGSLASDGYGTDDDSSHNGSILSRARPGEGNVLFGGRQRVYKIPVDSAGSKRSPGHGHPRGVGGRALYEDDISMSAFQKLREREREREQEIEEKELDENQPDDGSEKGSSHSPPRPVHARKRRTSSSTASQPSDTRSSTAATSITSLGSNTASSPAVAAPQPSSVSAGLERSTTKPKRLYEQGLNQHIHDQQSSAMTRLNSVQKQRAPNGTGTSTYLPQMRSASSLGDRKHRLMRELRAISPPPSAPLPNTAQAGSGSDDKSLTASPVLGHRQSPPQSPVGNGKGDSVLWSAIQPNDRGKATALGAFNKPKEQFSEHQYLQRQLSLQQGRRAASSKKNLPSEPTQVIQTVSEHAEVHANTAGTFQSMQWDHGEAPSAVDVFRNAANRMRSKVTDHDREEPVPETQQTFLSFAGSSDGEDEEAQPPAQPSDSNRCLPKSHSPAAPPDTAAPSVLQHPALRPSPAQLHKSDVQTVPQVALKRPESLDTLSKGPPTGDDISMPAVTDVDSPTLGPANGVLSGLVHQHLRNTSNQSSICSVLPAVPSPLQLKDQGRVPIHNMTEPDTPVHSSYANSNAWDSEDIDGAYGGEAASFSSGSPIESRQAHPGLTSNGSARHFASSRDPDTTGKASWDFNLRKQHCRGLSTETQQEQEAFATELAQRQRAIQENLRSKVENELRAPSPVPGMAGALRALGMLRSRSNRDSVLTKQEMPPKAMKMLGIAAASTNGSSTSLTVLGERPQSSDPWLMEDDKVGQEPRAMQMRARLQSEGDVHRQPDYQGHRAHSEEKNKGSWTSKGNTSPESSQSSVRNRSSSEVSSSRSRSRSGRFREDLERATVAEVDSFPVIGLERVPSVPQQYLEPASTLVKVEVQHNIPRLTGTPTAKPPVLRNDGKTDAPGYFDPSSLQPVDPAGRTANGLTPQPSPRTSPGAQSSATVSARPLHSMPYSANSTPPISIATTPSAPAPAGDDPIAAHGRLTSTSRKKHVQKSDISEPTLISMTSVVDTVDLPPGASLKNGQEDAPPVPPANSRRRRFGFGRLETSHEAAAGGHDSDDNNGRSSSRLGFLKIAGDGRGLGSNTRQLTARPSSPTMPQIGLKHSQPRLVEGGMF